MGGIKRPQKSQKVNFFHFCFFLGKQRKKEENGLNFTKNGFLPWGGDKISLRSSYSALEFYLNWKLHKVNFPAVERFKESFHKTNV